MARGRELHGVHMGAGGRAARMAGRRVGRRRGIGYVARLLAFGLAVLLGMAWVAPPVVFVYKSLYPARLPLRFPDTPPALPGAAPAGGPATPAPDVALEAVNFRTADGLTIRGLFGRAGAAAPVILLGHGYAANREQMLPQAAFLTAAGYSVLLFDWRAHGASDGALTSFGYYEAGDVRAALDYLESRPDLRHPRFGALGVSYGAGLMLYSAARDPRLAAVVCDSIYSLPAVEETFTGWSRTGMPVGALRFPVAPLADPAARFFLGRDLTDLDPRAQAAAVSPRPLLFIHSAEDRYPFTPLTGAQAIFAAAGAPKDLWIAPTGAHADLVNANPEEYRRRVLAFFARAFGHP